MGSLEYSLEKVPTIRIKHLRDSGMFRKSCKNEVAIKHHIPYLITYIPEHFHVRVEFVYYDEYYDRLVETAKSIGKYGGRVYLVCPKTRDRCSVLYLSLGGFVSIWLRVLFASARQSIVRARKGFAVSDIARQIIATRPGLFLLLCAVVIPGPRWQERRESGHVEWD